MTITFLNTDKAIGAAAPTSITGFNSVGADLLILTVDGAATSTNTTSVSDTQGNTWTKLNLVGNNSNQIQSTWYCLAPSTSASHGFTQSGATFATFRVSAWSGVSAFDQQVGRGNGGSGVNVSPGTVTPSVDGCLVLCLACSRATGTYTIDSGFSIVGQNPFVSGVNCGSAHAYLVQATAAGVTPTWNQSMASNLVVFKPSAGAINDSVSESGSAADTPSAAAVFASSVTESGSAADTPGAAALFASAVAESGNAVDSCSCVVIYAASVAEAGAAADSPSAAAIFAASVAEAGSASDTASQGAAATSVSCDEAGNAVDTCSAVVIFAGSVAEGTASAQDTAAAAAIWNAAVAESGSAQDATDITGRAPVLAIDPDFIATASGRDFTAVTARGFAAPGPGRDFSVMTARSFVEAAAGRAYTAQ